MCTGLQVYRLATPLANNVTGTFIGELSSMVEREVPWYRYQVDPYFFQEHVILLLILTYSGTGKTSTFSFFLEHL